MGRSENSRSSAAIIVAVIALTVAMAGTAVAGSTFNKITKNKVKTIAQAQIEAAAPSLSVSKANTANTAASAATATSAATAGTATTANSAKIATNVFSAQVAADGTMVRSIPDGATSSRAALGDYRVSFGRSFANCTYSVSASAATGGPSNSIISVGPQGGGDGTVLQVFSRTSGNVVADEPFSVLLICPAA